MSDQAAIWLKRYLGVNVYRALVLVGIWGLYYYMGSTYETRGDHNQDIKEITLSLESVRVSLQTLREEFVSMRGVDDRQSEALKLHKDEIDRLRNRLDAEK